VGVGIQPFWEEEQVYVGEVQVAASLRDFVRKEGRKLNWKQENIIEVIVVLLLLLLVCSKDGERWRSVRARSFAATK